MNMEHYLRPRSRPIYGIWVAIGVLLGLAAWLAAQAIQEHESMDRAARRNARLAALQAPVHPATPTRAEVDEQKHWAQLRQERDFPWARVFHAVERTSSADIELLEFRPDKVNHSINLHGEARDHKALIAYLEALAGQDELANVHLVHEQNVAHGTLHAVSWEIGAVLTN